MQTNIIKLSDGIVIKSKSLCRNLQIAYGRYVARLMHTPGGYIGRSIHLNDLPLSLFGLSNHHTMDTVFNAYLDECNNLHVPAEDRMKP